MIEGEPAIDQLLAEPIVQRLIAANRVEANELMRLIARVRHMLRP